MVDLQVNRICGFIKRNDFNAQEASVLAREGVPIEDGHFEIFVDDPQSLIGVEANGTRSVALGELNDDPEHLDAVFISSYDGPDEDLWGLRELHLMDDSDNVKVPITLALFPHEDFMELLDESVKHHDPLGLVNIVYPLFSVHGDVERLSSIHAKVLLFVYPERLRVVVTSANFLRTSWLFQAEVLTIVDLPISTTPSPADAWNHAHFGRPLLHFLSLIEGTDAFMTKAVCVTRWPADKQLVVSRGGSFPRCTGEDKDMLLIPFDDSIAPALRAGIQLDASLITLPEEAVPDFLDWPTEFLYAEVLYIDTNIPWKVDDWRCVFKYALLPFGMDALPSDVQGDLLSISGSAHEYNRGFIEDVHAATQCRELRIVLSWANARHFDKSKYNSYPADALIPHLAVGDSFPNRHRLPVQHHKILLMDNGRKGWVYAGSHNFTPYCWGRLCGDWMTLSNFEVGILTHFTSAETKPRTLPMTWRKWALAELLPRDIRVTARKGTVEDDGDEGEDAYGEDVDGIYSWDKKVYVGPNGCRLFYADQYWYLVTKHGDKKYCRGVSWCIPPKWLDVTIEPTKPSIGQPWWNDV
eukprot:GEMP01011453.1.p1 GENE.GEMP01011453.1~~GEMP01011453.1.p1  ORF type:complete len:582 (+),score=107.80 GEMP01011453.1:76-1821(+)